MAAEPHAAPPEDAETTDQTQARLRAARFSDHRDRLTFWERFNIAVVNATFTIGWVDRLMGWLQRVPGAFWVDRCTRNLLHVYGLERLGPLEALGGIILVANHRSFFDMFVANMILYERGYRHRFLYPVRSEFFYTSPAGTFVNFVMSFFSMYPPIFREKKRMALTHAAFAELSHAVLDDGRSAGIHPEGRRKKDDDPYTFLSPQPGVGRLAHLSRAAVVPIFINGLGNDLVKQVLGNFNGRGRKVIAVFGAPIDFGELLDEDPTPRTYRALAEKTLEVIGALGQEERALRAELEGQS